MKNQLDTTIQPAKTENNGISKKRIFIWRSFNSAVFDAKNKPDPQITSQGVMAIIKRCIKLPRANLN